MQNDAPACRQRISPPIKSNIISHTYTHKHAHTLTHSHIHTHKHTHHTHTHTHTRTHAHTHTHSHTNTHTRTHTHTHIHTSTHIHTRQIGIHLPSPNHSSLQIIAKTHQLSMSREVQRIAHRNQHRKHGVLCHVNPSKMDAQLPVCQGVCA